MDDNAKSYKILFLDDDQFILEMYSVKFANTKHEVRFASSADEAKKILEEGFEPDAIVFDLIMPGVQGFDFIADIKKDALAKNAALVALTNQGEVEDYDRADKLHIDAYIIKANHIPTEVVALIENAIEKKKQNNN